MTDNTTGSDAPREPHPFLDVTPELGERLLFATDTDGRSFIIGGNERIPNQVGSGSYPGTYREQLDRMVRNLEDRTKYWLGTMMQYQRGIHKNSMPGGFNRFTFAANGKLYTATMGERKVRDQYDRSALGFGGDRIRITSKQWTGVTNDMWLLGGIPPNLRAFMPDNATLDWHWRSE